MTKIKKWCLDRWNKLNNKGKIITVVVGIVILLAIVKGA
tara:strand:+ start:807 stop:923 length:117 start_codon:yes stop_codon:yes gene_type:complete